MEDLLILLLQFVFEVLFNALLYWPFDFPSRYRITPESVEIRFSCFIWFLAGCVIAGISLVFFSHTLIPLPSLRIASLILSPVASAYISQRVAWIRAESNGNIIPRNHFWQAFWFTLGYVALRFAYVSRVHYFS